MTYTSLTYGIDVHEI